MRKRWAVWPVALAATILFTGCGNPPTKVGEACQIDGHCYGLEGGFELTCDNTIPGGVCMFEGCTPDDPATPEAEDQGSCPAGSRCVREKDIPACKQQCAGDEQCQKGCENTGRICGNPCQVFDRLVCRRACKEQSDCREVIVCHLKYDKRDECEASCLEAEGDCISACSDQNCIDACLEQSAGCREGCQKKIYEECKNEMECSTFWDLDRSQIPENAPRACILWGRFYREAV